MNRKYPFIHCGPQLRDLSLKAGIGSQKELAERTGIAPNIISDLERGRRVLSPAWRERIAEAVSGYATDSPKKN